MASHTNAEVDVLLVGVSGTATVVVDGEAHELRTSSVVLVPKGTERSIAAGADGARYLTVHRARRGLSIGGAR